MIISKHHVEGVFTLTPDLFSALPAPSDLTDMLSTRRGNCPTFRRGCDGEGCGLEWRWEGSDSCGCEQ